MILVLGSNLSASDLPLSEELGYRVESIPSAIWLALKTRAKTNTCIKVYMCTSLSDTYSDFINSEQDISAKLEWFDTDEDLIQQLSGEAPVVKQEEEGTSEVATEPTLSHEELDAFNKSLDDDAIEADVLALELEEQKVVAEQESPETFEEAPVVEFDEFQPEVVGFDSELLRQRIATLEGALEQSNNLNAELRSKADEALDFASEELNKQENLFVEKLNEAKATIDELNETLASHSASACSSNWSKFESYATHSRAVLKSGLTTGLTPEELSEIHGSPDNMRIVTTGSPESYSSLITILSSMCLKGYSGLLVDLTGDHTLGSALKNEFRKQEAQNLGVKTLTPEQLSALPSIDLQKNLIKAIESDDDFAPLVQTTFFKERLIYSEAYHDIALLSWNWGKILEKLRILSQDTACVIVLPSVLSFASRYTVNRLASVIPVNVVVTSNTMDLLSFMRYSCFFASHSAKVIVSNYSKVAERLVTRLRQSFDVDVCGNLLVANEQTRAFKSLLGTMKK